MTRARQVGGARTPRRGAPPATGRRTCAREPAALGTRAAARARREAIASRCDDERATRLRPRPLGAPRAASGSGDDSVAPLPPRNLARQAVCPDGAAAFDAAGEDGSGPARATARRTPDDGTTERPTQREDDGAGRGVERTVCRRREPRFGPARRRARHRGTARPRAPGRQHEATTKRPQRASGRRRHTRPRTMTSEVCRDGATYEVLGVDAVADAGQLGGVPRRARTRHPRVGRARRGRRFRELRGVRRVRGRVRRLYDRLGYRARPLRLRAVRAQADQHAVEGARGSRDAAEIHGRVLRGLARGTTTTAASRSSPAVHGGSRRGAGEAEDLSVLRGERELRRTSSEDFGPRCQIERCQRVAAGPGSRRPHRGAVTPHFFRDSSAGGLVTIPAGTRDGKAERARRRRRDRGSRECRAPRPPGCGGRERYRARHRAGELVVVLSSRSGEDNGPPNLRGGRPHDRFFSL